MTFQYLKHDHVHPYTCNSQVKIGTSQVQCLQRAASKFWKLPSGRACRHGTAVQCEICKISKEKTLHSHEVCALVTGAFLVQLYLAIQAAQVCY